MRTFILSIVTILYLGLSTGTTVHMHYCMGKLVEFSFWNNDKSDSCSKCGMQKKASKNTCCKDEYKIVKIEQDQKITIAINHIVDLSTIDIVPNYFKTSPVFITSSFEKTSFSKAPPLAFNIAIYIRNCDFRI